MTLAGSSNEPTARTWTVLDLLRCTTEYFAKRKIENSRLDAECLLAAALGVDRMRLYIDFDKPVSAGERDVFREFVLRRATDRVPVAQLIGRKEFWSLPLTITPDVLIPRPDTETLVTASLDLLPDVDGEARVLEIGTGSGAVALAIAKERPKVRITATDISSAALAVARRNAEALAMSDRIRFVEGDLFEPVATEQFDLVVSNPPYLEESERDSLPPELAHEPSRALFAGPDGLTMLLALISGVARVLAPGAGFAVELAPTQAETVAQWCCEFGLQDATVYRDLAERPRVIAARASRLATSGVG